MIQPDAIRHFIPRMPACENFLSATAGVQA